MSKRIKKISVIGDGGWGTTLALYLDAQGYDVYVWGAFDGYTKEVARKRENVKFLPGIKIPKRIRWDSDLSSAIAHADLIVLASPSQYLADVLKKISRYDYSKKIFLSVVKGIEIESLKRMSQIIEEELGKVPLAVLSGP